MREIKFRGKAISDWEEVGIKKGDWVYGYYWSHHYISTSYIIAPDADYEEIDVDPETVGQFVRDINDVDYYDGDIIGGCVTKPSLIYWNNEYACFSIAERSFSPRPFMDTGFDEITDEDMKKIVYLGNIHDNPKLLEDKLEEN